MFLCLACWPRQQATQILKFKLWLKRNIVKDKVLVLQGGVILALEVMVPLQACCAGRFVYHAQHCISGVELGRKILML